MRSRRSQGTTVGLGIGRSSLFKTELFRALFKEHGLRNNAQDMEEWAKVVASSSSPEGAGAEGGGEHRPKALCEKLCIENTFFVLVTACPLGAFPGALECL